MSPITSHLSISCELCIYADMTPLPSHVEIGHFTFHSLVFIPPACLHLSSLQSERVSLQPNTAGQTAVLTASQGFGGTEKKRGVGQLCRQLYLDWKDRAVADLRVTLTRKASALAVLSTSSLYSLEVSGFQQQVLEEQLKIEIEAKTEGREALLTQRMPDGCSSTDSLCRVLANPVRVRCIMKTDLRTSQAVAFCSTPICETFFPGSQSDKAQVRKEQGMRIWTHNSWPGAQPENVVIATRALSWLSGRWIGCTLSS
ncbi:hypothetical protein QQF64_014781 [Cirrhinus molitorella]|uniref:Uncharacterized protein n=1 Tax=Cirrhinus molitorella TaxID=172907 RepID=A0ABR3NT33_9TELE